jgi:hypothetical protein
MPLSESACLPIFEPRVSLSSRPLVRSPSFALKEQTLPESRSAETKAYTGDPGECDTCAMASISGCLVYAGVVAGPQASAEKAAQEHQQEGADGDPCPQ